MIKPGNKDPSRPDGRQERLVRIETRLVKFQESNALFQNEVRQKLDTLHKQLEEFRHGDQ